MAAPGDRLRMFLDESYLLECPSCKTHFHFHAENVVIRVCVRCNVAKPLKDFKYDSDTSYRQSCKPCFEAGRGKNKIEGLKKLTYTIITCVACLREGESEAGSKVIFCSKGLFDSLDPIVEHRHQKNVFKAEPGREFNKEKEKQHLPTNER